MTSALKDVLEHHEFLKQLVYQSLRTRYRGSILGFVWAFVTPLLFFVSFTIIFSYINRADIRTFGIYFFSGYVPWAFFVSAATQATTSVLGNANLLTRIRTPTMVYPFVAVLVNCVDFLVGMLLVLALMVLLGKPLTLALASLPIAMVLLFVFVTGVCYAFAAINVFMRDFGFLWNSFSTIWFFFTPILYTLDSIPPHARVYFQLNPILPFIQAFQQPVCNGALPSGTIFLLAGLYAGVTFILGTFLYFRSQKSFYLYL